MSEKEKKGLSEWYATAISGNDITASCIYASPLALLYSGKWAWVPLLMVAVVLYFYRSIYGEVVGALPLNGGAYNALLNTTSKFVASLAATCTILSYMATSVVSANEAINYLQTMWHSVPIIPATIAVLAIFMFLAILGTGESSKVAMIIFVFHLSSLALLIIACVWGLFAHGTTLLIQNLHIPTQGSLPIALLFGFSASMLGITGFETSSNFVEEQNPGVFPKTLRNMWVLVTIINPLIGFLALSVVPLNLVNMYSGSLLSYMGGQLWGQWFALLISIDAVCVLSGSVLTSFIGVTGLVHRLVLDRCLPQFLLKESKFKTQHRVIITFFILCVSILLVTKGSLTALAGVFTVAFLTVMCLFGIGNLLLKIRRSGLHRPEEATWVGVIFAITAVLVALAGNIYMNPMYIQIFFSYFIPAVTVIIIMLHRTQILYAYLFFVQSFSSRLINFAQKTSSWIQSKINEINSQQIVFFTRGEDIANINLALLYVRNNEHSNKVKIVTVVKEGEEVSPNLRKDIEFLDRVYHELGIEFVVLTGKFTPELIKELSEKWNIPTNYMFIATPRGKLFTYTLAELGGVRLIS